MGDNWRCAQLASCSRTSMYVGLCLLNHGAVSVLCLACDDEALSCERRVLISTNGYTMEGTRLGFQLVAVECSFTVPVLIQKHPL